MSKKYTQLAKDIVELVGGKANVDSVIHCVTRLRFRLNDESKADDEGIRSLNGVIALVKSAGEYMVVIGEHVPEVYDEVCKVLGISGETKVEESKTEEKKKSFIEKALGLTYAGMGPTLNLLCACGIIKGLNTIFVMLGLSMESGIYLLLNAAGDAIFYGMPVFMGYNIAKYLEIDPYFGFLFGTALTYPSIQGVDLNVLGITVNATYTSTFLPVLFGILLATPIYKFFKQKLPQSLNGFLTPMLTLLIAFPITFIVIGPVANTIGNYIAVAMDYLFVKVPLIAPVIFAGIFPILVMFGIHGVVSMMAFYALLAGNPSALLAASTFNTFVVAGVLFGLRAKTKDKELKNACSPAIASAVMGVSEPGLYGMIISRKVLLVILCVGCAASGLVVGIFNMKMYSYTGLGLIGLIGLINPNDSSAMQFVAIALAVVVPAVIATLLTLIFYKEDGSNIQAGNNKENKKSGGISITSPIDGEVKDITESTDASFASEASGKGVVILPNNGEVYSPVSGQVKVVFPTGHAIGLVTDEGCEVLIHIGVNTVNLQGKYFTTYVKQGDKVNVGDKLVSFDKENIEKEGYSSEVIMVVTNTNDYLDVVQIKQGKTFAKEDVMKVIK